MEHAPGHVTELLLAWGEGRREALDQRMPLVHPEMRRLAHAEMRRHALGTP